MKNATVHDGHKINVFELMLACHDFEKNSNNRPYDVYPGNNCVWISSGGLNLYYIFRDGKIADIQVD